MSADASDIVYEGEKKEKKALPVPLLIGLALILFVAGLLLVGSAFLDAGPAPDAPADQGAPAALPVDGPPLQVGDRPYAFSLANLDGDEVSLESHLGRPVIVNFWATWCGPCRIEMPELQAAYEAHQEDGLAILALDRDESPEAVARFFHDEFNLTFTPLLDEGGDTARRYGLGNSLPASVFISPEGEITAIHRGLMDRNLIEAYLAETIPPG